MIGAVFAALLAAADCQSPAVHTLEADRQPAGCALLARQASATTVDRPSLGAIYERPGFERARLRNQGTIEQLMRRAKAWFDSIFESRGAETYSVVTRFLVLLAAALAAGWAALKLMSTRGHAVAARPGVPGPQALHLEDPTEHLRRARALLGGDPRGALREGLLALLSVLEQRRLARPDRVKTNRELSRELPTRGASAELSGRVEVLLTGYDRRFYSLEPVSAPEAARFLDDVERLAST